MTSPTPPPPLPPAASVHATPQTPHRPSPFFDWIREAGIVRSRGWLGGVAAGISARTGIDVALIRGIFVVIAVLGFPAVLLYALLWLVLPDENDSIAMQQLLRGRFQPQMIGILATFIFAMVPFSSLISRVWEALAQPIMMVAVDSGDGGITYYSEPSYSFASSGSTLLAFLLPLGAFALALLVAIVIVALARRRSARQAAAMVPAPAAATAGMNGAGVDEDADPLLPAEAAPPAAGDAEPVSADEYAQWREQHAQTQRDRDAYLVAQQTDDAAAERAREENAAQRGDFMKQMAARRAERRAANPRASLGYNLGVVGVAGVAACVVMLIRSDDLYPASAALGPALALGAFVGALVLAIGMIIAGALRRRSGFLALATVAALIVGGGATVATRPSSLVWDGAGVLAGEMPEVNQPFGWLQVYAVAYQDDHIPMKIVKGDGYTSIFVDAGVNLEFDGTIGDGGSVGIRTESVTGETEYQDVAPYKTGNVDAYSVEIRTYRSDIESVTQKITLDQTSGWVEIIVQPDWSAYDDSSNATTSEITGPDISVKK